MLLCQTHPTIELILELLLAVKPNPRLDGVVGSEFQEGDPIAALDTSIRHQELLT